MPIFSLDQNYKELLDTIRIRRVDRSFQKKRGWLPTREEGGGGRRGCEKKYAEQNIIEFVHSVSTTMESICRSDSESTASKRCEKIRERRTDAKGDL